MMMQYDEELFLSKLSFHFHQKCPQALLARLQVFAGLHNSTCFLKGHVELLMFYHFTFCDTF